MLRIRGTVQSPGKGRGVRDGGTIRRAFQGVLEGFMEVIAP